MELARPLPIEVNLWEVQNSYYSMARSVYHDMEERAAKGDPEGISWVREFVELGVSLNFDTEHIPGE
jgi:hypothetical protein